MAMSSAPPLSLSPVPYLLVSTPRQPHVSTVSENSPTAAIPLNALPRIRERMASGRVSWTGPLLLVCARPVLLMVSQAVMAIILFVAHRPAPWSAAGDWWNVYGTVVDLGCLTGLRYFTRKEGVRLRDLTARYASAAGTTCSSALHSSSQSSPSSWQPVMARGGCYTTPRLRTLALI